MSAEPILLVSDVDYTLLGDDAAIERFAQWHRGQRERFVLAYASGRFYDSIAESVRTTALPEPDYIIGGVGTELREFTTGEPIAGWEANLRDWKAARVRGVLAGRPELLLQPAEFLSDRKISYHFHNASPAAIDEIRQALANAGIAAEVIYSSARDLDILPGGVSKGAAAVHLANYLGIERVIACGDSGNDASLMQQGFCGVVVANALDELKRLCSDCVYLSPHACAAGVLDGIRHWLETGVRPRADHS